MLRLEEEPEYPLFSKLCFARRIMWIPKKVFLVEVQERKISEEFLIRALEASNTSICNGAFIVLGNVPGEHIIKALMRAMRQSQYLTLTDCAEIVRNREDFSKIFEQFLKQGDEAFK